MIPDQQTEKLLKRCGFGQLPAPCGAAVAPNNGLCRFQQWHGLDVTGELDTATEHVLVAPRICAHPDHSPLMAVARADLLAWKKHSLTYHIVPEATFGALPRDAVEAAFVWAWLRWSSNCNIFTTPVGTRAAADVVITTGTIDGPWRSLAYSEFPDGSDMQRVMKFDSEEKWSYSSRPISRFAIDLAQCAMHEIGHVLGIPHLPGECVMSPIYDRRIDALYAADITEARLRYP